MIKITDLTLDEKIGQLLMVGFEGQTLGESTIDMIKKYKIGNIIHFSRNIGSTEQIFKLNKELQKLIIETTGIPALISVDQEGGMVTRIYDKSTVFPGAMTIAATDNEYNAYLSGLYMGEELDALGFNMNFAPVLDVNNNPNNPVIGVRSFSDQPQKVSKYTKAFIDGLQNIFDFGIKSGVKPQPAQNITLEGALAWLRAKNETNIPIPGFSRHGRMRVPWRLAR